jgi:uncharacterized lipoprotein NlpE involved in copper resistance
MKYDFAETENRVRSRKKAFIEAGASVKFAEAFALAAVDAEEAFASVTGGQLALLQFKGIPVEYAVHATQAGYTAQQTVRLWLDGVPLEYVTA